MNGETLPAITYGFNGTGEACAPDLADPVYTSIPSTKSNLHGYLQFFNRTSAKFALVNLMTLQNLQSADFCVAPAAVLSHVLIMTYLCAQNHLQQFCSVLLLTAGYCFALPPFKISCHMLSCWGGAMKICTERFFIACHISYSQIHTRQLCCTTLLKPFSYVQRQFQFGLPLWEKCFYGLWGKLCSYWILCLPNLQWIDQI